MTCLRTRGRGSRHHTALRLWTHRGLALLALAGGVASQDVDEQAERALLARGAEAIGVLVEDLRPGEAVDPARLAATLRVIGQLGPVAGDSAATLSALLGSCIESCPTSLRPAMIRARASLAPYSGDRNWHQTFHKIHEQTGAERKEWFVQHMRHNARLGVGARLDAAACLALLRRNQIFAREVAAEQLGAMTEVDADVVTALHDALRDRETRPNGWDGLRHNGIVEPIDDEFRLRAAQALVRLAPRDERSAVAYGVIAARHPYQTVRREALRTLAGFALAASAALPEVIAATQSQDPATTAAALEVLGMIGPDAVAALPHVAKLAAATDAAVAARARALQQQLLAVARRSDVEVGGEVRSSPPSAASIAIGQLADPAQRERATAALVALGEEAITALLERVRADGAATPDVVLEALVAVGLQRPRADREDLIKVLLHYNGEHWEAPSMSSSSGGTRGPLQLRLITALQFRGAGGKGDVGDDLAAHCELLGDQSPLVRLEAARQLGARLQPPPSAADARALIAALRTVRTDPQPQQFELELQRSKMTVQIDVEAEIAAAAGAALEELAAHPDSEVAAKARAALAAPRKR